MIRTKMFGFINKMFLAGLTVLSYVNQLSTNQLSCISMTNKKCKVGPEIINVNTDLIIHVNTVKC